MNIHLSLAVDVSLAIGAAEVGGVAHPKGIKRKHVQKDAAVIPVRSSDQVAAMAKGLCGFLYFSMKTQGLIVCDQTAKSCAYKNHVQWRGLCTLAIQ